MSENNCASIIIIVMAIMLIFASVTLVKYKRGMEEALVDFFSTCVKIDDKTIQCPIPK